MFCFDAIGVIRTPYEEMAPFHPLKDAPGSHRIELLPRYVEGLRDLAGFSHIHVLFVFHRRKPGFSLIAHPPRLPGEEVGVFASRSPRRPNALGLSTVRLLKIEGPVLHLGSIDALDGTPVLDIKPYLRHLDLHLEATQGWFDRARPISESPELGNGEK